MISLETSLQKPPAQENLAVQTRQVANLTASRQILLTSFRTSEQTVATLRSDLSALRSELDASASASAQRISELEAQVEELDEVKDELVTQRKELERLEKGGKKGDLERQKELEKERKELEKERSRREKLENEVKALKASPSLRLLAGPRVRRAANDRFLLWRLLQTQLKTTESALQAAEKAKASQAKAALSRSSSTIKATPHPTSDVEQDATDQDEVEPAVGEPVDEAAGSEAVEPEPEPAEAYKPSKCKSRSAPAPKPAAAVKDSKKGKATAARPDAVEVEAAEAGSDASEAESTPPTPKKAADPPKKRKADVLGDKSTNARASQRGDEGAGLGVGLKVKKAKKAADGSKVSALAFAFGGDSDDDAAANNKSKKNKKKRGAAAEEGDDDDEGQLQKKQTKKRTLLGPRKKFDWTAEVSFEADGPPPPTLNLITFASVHHHLARTERQHRLDDPDRLVADQEATRQKDDRTLQQLPERTADQGQLLLGRLRCERVVFRLRPPVVTGLFSISLQTGSFSFFSTYDPFLDVLSCVTCIGEQVRPRVPAN